MRFTSYMPLDEVHSHPDRKISFKPLEFISRNTLTNLFSGWVGIGINLNLKKNTQIAITFKTKEIYCCNTLPH